MRSCSLKRKRATAPRSNPCRGGAASRDRTPSRSCSRIRNAARPSTRSSKPSKASGSMSARSSRRWTFRRRPRESPHPRQHSRTGGSAMDRRRQAHPSGVSLFPRGSSRSPRSRSISASSTRSSASTSMHSRASWDTVLSRWGQVSVSMRQLIADQPRDAAIIVDELARLLSLAHAQGDSLRELASRAARKE